MVIGGTRLTFEEMTTVLAQIEACLNSRPLTALPEVSDGIDALTPGHFLIGRPLEAIPEGSCVPHSSSLIKRWYLWQSVVQHFWQRWSKEYLCHLQRYAKWNVPSENLKVGDVVCLRGEQITTPTQWILGRIKEVHPGPNGKVRVVTMKTPRGIYRRPVTKIVPLVASNELK